MAPGVRDEFSDIKQVWGCSGAQRSLNGPLALVPLDAFAECAGHNDSKAEPPFRCDALDPLAGEISARAQAAASRGSFHMETAFLRTRAAKGE